MSDTIDAPDDEVASGLTTQQVKRRMARLQAMESSTQVRRSHYKLMRDVLEAIATGSGKTPKRLAAAALLPKAEAAEQEDADQPVD